MRASVVDRKRSSSKQATYSFQVEASQHAAVSTSRPASNHRGSGNTSYPNIVYIKPTPKQPFSFSFVPDEGWLVLILLAVAIYCVVAAIVGAGWITHSRVLFLAPAVGLLVGLVVAKIPRLPQSILHIAACLIGHWF